MNSTLLSIVLALLFLSDDFLIKNFKFINFFYCFLPFFVKCILSVGKIYFKIVFYTYNVLFFITCLPAVIQYSFLFTYCFEYIWDIFLLLSIYSLIFSFPFYCYSFFSYHNLKCPRHFKYVLLVIIIFILDSQNAIALNLSVIIMDQLRFKFTKRYYLSSY